MRGCVLTSDVPDKLFSVALGPHPQRVLALMPRLAFARPRLGMAAGAAVNRYYQPHQRSSFRRTQKFDRATDQRGTLAHPDDPQTSPRQLRIESLPVIFDFELEPVVGKLQPYPGAIGAGMTRHVVQRFLQYPIDVDAHRAVDWPCRAAPLIRYGDPGLALNDAQVPVDRPFQSGCLERRRMQRLRHLPRVVQRGLGDVRTLLQVGWNRRAGRQLTAGPPEHRPDCRQHLAELVVKLSRDFAKCRLSRLDELLCELATVVGQRGELREQ